MNSFDWVDAHSVDEATRLLSTGTDLGVAKAGGIDLLDLMKEGLVRPTRVVNLRSIDNLDSIQIDAQGNASIGALTTLAQIARDPNILKHFGALAAAADHAATPQVRNVATIGGNLLQRPRCWYFRNEQFAREKVADAARRGENQYHAIFDTDRTPLVHASTPATALLAYDAVVHVASLRGKRSIAIGDLFLAPEPARASDVTLAPGEVITHITLPATLGLTVSAYHKQTERDSYDWPICDVAVVLRVKPDRTVESASIALGWVAPTPMRASEAEALLIGKRIDDALAAQAARATVAKAKPLSRNAYKVEVLEAVIRRVLLSHALPQLRSP